MGAEAIADNPETGPKEARAEVLAQHKRLRSLMQHIGLLARAATLGAVVPELRRRIILLLEAVKSHNEHEATILRPLLASYGAWGSELIREMIAHHDLEHRTLEDAIAGACRDGLQERERAHMILSTLDEMEKHMLREEAAVFIPDREGT